MSRLWERGNKHVLPSSCWRSEPPSGSPSFTCRSIRIKRRSSQTGRTYRGALTLTIYSHLRLRGQERVPHGFFHPRMNNDETTNNRRRSQGWNSEAPACRWKSLGWIQRREALSTLVCEDAPHRNDASQRAEGAANAHEKRRKSCQLWCIQIP